MKKTLLTLTFLLTSLNLYCPGAKSETEEKRLLRCIETGNVEEAIEVYSYLASAGQDAPNTDESGQPTLHLAVQSGVTDMVSVVLDDINLNINALDPSGNTALHIAAKLGNRAIIDRLLRDDDINPMILNTQNKKASECTQIPELVILLETAEQAFRENQDQE